MRRNLVFALITTVLLSAAVALELRDLQWGGGEGADVPPQEPAPRPPPIAAEESTAPRDPVEPDIVRLPPVDDVAADVPAEVPQLAEPSAAAPQLDDALPPPSSPPEDVGLVLEEGDPTPARPMDPEHALLKSDPSIAPEPVPTDDDAGPRWNAQDDEVAEESSSIQRLPPIRRGNDRPTDWGSPATTANDHQPPPAERSVRAADPPLPPSERWEALKDHALNDYAGRRYNTSAEPRPGTRQDRPPSARPAPPQASDIVQRAASWWSDLVRTAQREESRPQPLDLATLVQETILNSEHIKAISLEPRIRETEITQADAAFDPTAFIESKWNDLSDPVGNLLTTGGPPRLSNEEWTSRIGFRRKIRTGGRVEIAQKLTEQDSNSVFFVPANQATSRLTLSLEQPLLKGGGKTYNRSLIILAQHDTQVARDRFQSDLQAQVLRVVSAYWDLYYQRAVLLQQKAALAQAEQIRADIEARQSFDSLASQVSRVTATVSIRRAGVVGAQAGVKNAEARLRALTTSPLLGGASEPIELIPVEPPLEEAVELQPEVARQLALENRTEIDAALTEVRAAGVRLRVAENEMLPSLGLVLSTYVSGLEGNFALARSFGDQFSLGAPSYTAGAVFEIPLGRRAAGAVFDRRVLELRQAEADLRQTTANLSAEVDIALRNVDTKWQEFLARRDAVQATASEVRQKRARLNLIPGDDHASVSIHLDDLLNAIDRLVNDETALAEAQRNYAVSIAEFHRATGMLLNVETTGPPHGSP